MLIPILIIIGLFLVLLIGFFVLKAILEKKEGESASPASEQKNEKSLSAIYAEKKRLWVCPFCETLNTKDATSCAACGKRR